jgi:hypothetical protein
VTKAAIEKGVEIYEALPPIRATYSRPGTGSGYSYGGAVAPVYLSPTANSGGCFTGDTMVRLLNGFKRVDELQAGDLLLDPSYEIGNKIRCVVRYDVNTPQFIVRFGDAGLTEFHPVLINEEWDHPRNLLEAKPEDLDSVYNVILETGHMIILMQDNNSAGSKWLIACTLAHTFTGPIISHSYFGASVPGMPNILDDIVWAPTWATGYVVCKNTREERNSMGEIIRLICDFA